MELAPLLQEVLAAVTAQLGQGRRQWRLGADFAGLALLADRRALRGARVGASTRGVRSRPPSSTSSYLVGFLRSVMVTTCHGGGIGAPAFALDRSALIRGLRNRVAALEEQVGQLPPDVELDTQEPAFQKVLDVAFHVAPTEATPTRNPGTSSGVKFSALVSLLIWMATLACGRLIAYFYGAGF